MNKLARKLSIGILLLLPMLSESSFGNEHILNREPGPKTFPQDIINVFSSGDQSGVLSAFKGAPELRASPLQMSYYLTNNNNPVIDVLISNQTHSMIHHKFLCFIDYQQVPFTVDKKARFYKTSIDGGKTQQFTIKINTPLTKGPHDMLIIGIDSTAKSTHGNRFVYNISHRSNLYVNNINHDNRQLIKNTKKNNSAKISLITIKKKKDSFHDLIIKNINAYSIKYAVLLLQSTKDSQNIKEIAIEKASSNQKTRFLTVKANHSAIINIDKKIPEDQQLQAILIEQPFLKLEMDDKMVYAPTNVIFSNIAHN